MQFHYLVGGHTGEWRQRGGAWRAGRRIQDLQRWRFRILLIGATLEQTTTASAQIAKATGTHTAAAAGANGAAAAATRTAPAQQSMTIIGGCQRCRRLGNVEGAAAATPRQTTASQWRRRRRRSRYAAAQIEATALQLLLAAKAAAAAIDALLRLGLTPQRAEPVADAGTLLMLLMMRESRSHSHTHTHSYARRRHGDSSIVHFLSASSALEFSPLLLLLSAASSAFCFCL